MIKITVNPITNKVLSYTKIQSNTPVYNTDIIINENELPENLVTPMMYTDDGFVEITKDNCETEIEVISKRLSEISGVTDNDYFMQLIMEGKDISEAREAVKARKEEWDALTARKEEIEKQHEEHIQQYYLEQNKDLDAALECKYYTAVVLLIKNENRYLKEWLDWHLSIGFQHIYIYDNGDIDHVQDIVDTYNADVQQMITVVDWTGHHTHIQQDAYNHFMSNYKQDVRWGLFIDSDEFLRFTDEVTTDVNAFLKAYEEYTEIWGYEVEYDANGQEKYENKPVRERFTRRTDAREGFYWKNFVQVNRIDSFLMHYAYYDPAKHLVFKNEQSNQDLFVIDHYYTKSWEEWQWKIKERGGADPNYHKALREFFYYNPDMAYLDTGENVHQAYE